MLNSLFRDLPSDANPDTAELRDWFSELLQNFRGSRIFDQALNTACSFTPRPGNPAFSVSLTAAATHRLSLLAIHPAKPIPLHDHPGGWGAQMVLSGQTLIRHCDQNPRATGSAALSYLRTLSERELGPGGIGSHAPDVRNIHTLAATGGTAVLLSIQLPPGGERRQHWFFPVDPPRLGQPLLLCHRVSKKTRPAHPEIEE